MRKELADESEFGRLPVLLRLAAVKTRMELIFPDTFANRGILTGDMAARVVYVFLYGGFVEAQAQRLRPSHVYFFTREQAEKTSVSQRMTWRRNAGKPGFRPTGKRWYADNSRETIRDDLMRNTMLRLGIAHKQAGIPVTSSKPTWYLDGDFASLLDPSRLAENRAAVGEFIALAWTDLDQAFEYLLLLPRRAVSIRAFCVLPLLYAYATLRELTRTDEMLRPGGVVKISRGEVRSLMVAGLAALGSNALLRRLVASVRERPFAPLAGLAG